MTTKTTLYLLLAVLMSACLPDTRRSALDNLRTAAMNDAMSIALEMGPYSAKYGDEQAKTAAMDSVKRTLKDPASARFQNLRVQTHPEGKIVCGEVNAKNSFGGYVGFRQFIAGSTHATIQDIDKRHPEIAAAANFGITTYCGYK